MIERVQDGPELVDLAGAARHSPVLHVLPLVISVEVIIVREELVSLRAGIASKSLSTSDLGEIVDPGKLQDGGHAVEEATDDEPVQGRGVLDLGQVRPAVHGNGGEGEYGRHS